MAYMPTKEEQEAYMWCVRNNIRISPASGYIEVNLDGDPVKGKWHRSPERYEGDALWEKYYEICTYYYNKKNK